MHAVRGSFRRLGAHFRARGGGLALVLAGQFGERVLEILGLAEIAIDRGKAHIGHVVEVAQMLHHRLADGLGRHFAFAQTFQLADDLRHHLLDPLRLDRALAQRNRQRAHQLVAIERHAPAVALDHHKLAQLHALEGGEAEIAGQADAAAADRGRILGRPRVLHLGIEGAAARTAHASPLTRRFTGACPAQ